MQGFLPGVSFREEMGVGGGDGKQFRVIGAVRKPDSCTLTQTGLIFCFTPFC